MTFAEQRAKILGLKNPQASASAVRSGASSFQNQRMQILNAPKPKAITPVKTNTKTQPVTQVKKGGNILDLFKQSLEDAAIDAAMRIHPVGHIASEVLSREQKKKIAQIATDLGKEVLRATPRSAMSTALSLTGQKTYTPGGGGSPKVEKFVYGNEEVKDIRGMGEETIKSFGGSDKTAQKFALPLGAGIVALDLIPGFPGKKKVVEKIAGEKSVGVIKSILNKDVFKNAPDEFVTALSRKLAPITDAKKVEEEIDYLTKVDRTKSTGIELSKSTEEILQGRRNQVLRLDGGGSTDPSLSKSPIDASLGVAGRVEPSALTTRTSGVSKSTENNLPSNRTNFLSEFNMTSPSKSNYSTYYKEIQLVRSTFDEVGQSVAGEVNGTFISRLKEQASLERKLIRKNQTGKRVLGDMNDTLAGTVVADDVAQAVESAISKGIKVSTDYREKPTFLGYKGVHADLELPNGAVGEVQFNTKQGLYQKTLAHQIYDKWREFIEYNGETTLNDVLKRISKDKYAEFLKDVARSIDIYDGKVEIPPEVIKNVDAKLSKAGTQNAGSTPAFQDAVNIARSEGRAVRLQKTPEIGQKIDISQSEVSQNFDESLTTTIENKSLQRQVGAKEAIEKTSKETGDPPSTVKRVVDSISEAKTKLVEYVQNEAERVRLNEGKEGVDTTFSPYTKMTLKPGRIQFKIDEVNKEAEELVKEAKKIADQFGTDSKTIRKEVNDYLRFRHAPERNAAIGERAAGVSDAEAKAGLEALENSPRGKEIKALADKAQKMNEQVLDMLKAAGVISEELFTTLRTRYKNHVPLQRILEDSEDIGSVLSGKGLDVKSTGIKSAKGSELEVEDIVGNIVNNYQQAVLRSEKNIVDNETLNFFRSNKDLYGDIVNIRSPKAVGKTFDDKPLLETTQDPKILQMFENGKKVWIEINDPAMAMAYRAVGKENIGGIMQAVSKFTRLYSGLATRFNPEFALPNKIRDLQETAVYLASQEGVGFSGAGKTVVRDLAQQNTKAILDYLRGTDSEGARLYKELKEVGGTTGGFGLSTKEVVFKNLEDLENLANSKVGPKKLKENLVKYVDAWNTIFEDSTRLSVYRQSLAQGLSKERAAFLAKEASINFNRMGRGGPVINALWMFSNASIQGSTKMVRAMKNPKVLAATVATVGTSVSVVNHWNDQVDPEWRDKVTKWDRLNGLPIMLPSEDGQGSKYITIPVSWGMKPIKVMSDFAYDAVTGQGFDTKDFAETVFTAMLEAYNPAGGTDLVSALTPTLLDIPAELSRNQSWSGSKIRPDFDKDAPGDIQYFESLAKTKTGEAAISITEMLQSKTGIAISPADLKYAFDGYVGGAGRAASKTVNTISGFASGDIPPADEFPMVSRLYRERTQDEIDSNPGLGKDEREVDTLIQEEKREDFKSKEDLRPLYQKVQELVKDGKEEEAQGEIEKLTDDEWEIYKSLKETDKRRNTNAEKQRMYPVVLQVMKLKDAGKDDVAQEIVDIMSEEDYADYERAKKALGFE